MEDFFIAHKELALLIQYEKNVLVLKVQIQS